MAGLFDVVEWTRFQNYQIYKDIIINTYTAQNSNSESPYKYKENLINTLDTS